MIILALGTTSECAQKEEELGNSDDGQEDEKVDDRKGDGQEDENDDDQNDAKPPLKKKMRGETKAKVCIY